MLEIRFANYDDYDLITKIDSTITKSKWKAWTNNKQAVVTFLNKEFCGWLQYSLFNEKIPFVNRLYVFEEYQRDGLGTGLMKFWEFEMVEMGYTKLMLSTEESNGAQKFYKKLGYKEMGKYDCFGEHNELILGKEVSLNTGCCCGGK